jgi:PAS domain S-box-containing protein
MSSTTTDHGRRTLEPGDGSPAAAPRAGDAWLQTLLNATAEGIYGLDAEGNTTFLNPAAARMLGWQPEELFGRPQHELIHHTRPDGSAYDRAACPIQATLAEGVEHAVEDEVFWRRDGTSFPVSYTAVPILEGDLVTGAVITFRDVSEQRRYEEALLERARHAALSADVGAAIADGGSIRLVLQRCAEAVVRHLDAAFARIWTLNEAEDLLELQASAGLYTHLNGSHGRVPVGALKIGRIASERRPHLTNDVLHDPRVGDPEWARREGMVSFAGYPLIADQRLVGVLAMFARQPLSDATLDALRAVADRIALIIERKETEVQLLEREDQLSEAQRIAHLGSWEWEPGSGKVAWSEELYRIHGLEPSAEPRSLEEHLERVAPEDRDRVRGLLTAASQEGSEFDFEETVLRADGVWRTLRVRGGAIPERAGRSTRVVGTSQDVTDQAEAMRRELELAREQALRQRAEAEQESMRFMVEAGGVLSSSLDYETTLGNLAHLVVPELADWCAIDLLDEDGTLRRVVTAHQDPARERLAIELEERYPSDPEAPGGLMEVLRAGRPQLVREIPPELLRASAVDEEHLRMIEELQLRSYMVVPLIARGNPLGAITFVSAESGELYDEQDLSFVQELAHRAAMAVDNARLFRQAESSRQRITRVLESIADAFFALDHRWRFTYLNDEAERLLRRSRGEMLGRSVWEAFPDAAGSRFEQEYRRAVDTHRTVEFEEYFAPLDCWFEVRAFPSEDGLSVYFRNVNERHRAESELRESEERFRSLVEATSAIVWYTPPSGEFEEPQPEWSRFTGQSDEEVLGWGWLDAVHPDDRVETAAAWKRAMQDWSVLELEHRLRRRDGQYRFMQVRAVPIVGRDSEIREWVGVHTDITEQKRAEEALRESEERFRFMTDAVPVQIWTGRPDGALDFVSGRTAEYFGRTPEALVAEGWQAVIHPDDLPAVAARWAHSLTTGEPYEVQFRLRGAEGEYRWYLGRAVAQLDRAGHVLRWFGSNTDIQEQKESDAERERLIAALEVERRRLETVFDNAPAAIAVTRGPDHRFVTANPAYRRMVAREVVGRTMAEAFPELEDQAFLRQLEEARSTGEAFVGDETYIRLDRDGDGAMEDGYFNFVFQPLTDSLGQIQGVMTFAVEVTEQVRARQEVERKAAELGRLARALEVTNRELDQFAYVASHDLKAPLRGIANLSTWIEEDLEGAINDEVREHLDLLRGRVHRMEGLIDGILQYSRAGRVKEKPEEVDTCELVEDALDLLALPDSVRVEVQPEMPTLVTERLPLQQVFLNLISNAAKYNDAEHPRIEVGWEDAGEEYQFRVSDNGPGIDPEYHDRIFGIFQTLEARDKVEGTGIGLSLVKKLVESRGGRVWVESQVGEGATFRLLWPKRTRNEDER